MLIKLTYGSSEKDQNGFHESKKIGKIDKKL